MTKILKEEHLPAMKDITSGATICSYSLAMRLREVLLVMKITMYNPVAPFVAIGQKLNFKIGKEVAGKCEIVSVDTETNAIGIGLSSGSCLPYYI